MNIKIRLLQLGKRQVDLMGELEKRGYKSIVPSTLSNCINYKMNTPQAYSIREECDRILTEWESEGA